MRNIRKALVIPLLALLFVGSGCEELLGEIFLDFALGASGSPGITPKDVVGASGTGDKDKDGLLDMGIAMGDDIKAATELENAGNAALAGQPPDYETAIKNLEQASARRPDDWSLKNQLQIAQAERGGATPTLNHPSHLCPEDKNQDTEDRCVRAALKERSSLLTASVARQKQSDQLVSCATQETIQRHYDFLGRLYPIELARLGISVEQAEEFGRMALAAEAAAKSPGVTCRR